MTCPRPEDLSAYVDQALPPREQARLARHLPGCPLCRARIDALQALRADLSALPSPAPGFDLAAQLGPLLRPPRPARPRRLPWGLSGWVPAGLASGLALVSGLWLGGLLLGGGGMATAPGTALVRVFDPVPPGGLCAAAELCRVSKGMP